MSLRIAGGALALALLLSGATVGSAAAETELSIAGQLRARSLVDGRALESGLATRETSELRTRVTLEARTEGNVRAFVQFQDSRTLGAGGASGGLVNSANVDLHQAFVAVPSVVGDWGLQAGRFEVNLGNQRVFGAVGWHNIGRSWEGASLSYGRDDTKVTAFWLKRMELDDPDEDRDFNVAGLNAEIPAVNAEFFAFWEHDADEIVAAVTEADRLDRFSLGTYGSRKVGGATIEWNGVYQLGERGVLAGTEAVEQDIGAYLVTAEVGTAVADSWKVAAGVDLASGDDPDTDGDFEGYDNLYYTGHKFRGAMDYFLASNPEGLLDVIGRAAWTASETWTLRGALHWFRTAQEYTDFQGEETSAVGTELDLSVSSTAVAGVRIDGGFSVFLPDESFAGTEDDEIGTWGYVSLTTDFRKDVD